MSADVVLGFGGNTGDPVRAIETALARLNDAGVSITTRSRFYRTTPWGKADQPDFLNLCALARTAFRPDALLALTQELERGAGRKAGERWGPRPLDIDILAFDDLIRADCTLTLPHPRLTERAFVLLPLAEIAPERVIAGRTVADWATRVDRTGVVAL